MTAKAAPPRKTTTRTPARKAAPAGAKATAARVDVLEQTVAKQREDIDTLTWLLAIQLAQQRKAQAQQIAAKLAPHLAKQIEDRLAAGLPLTS